MPRETFKLFYSKSRKTVLINRYMGRIPELSFDCLNIPFSEIKSSSIKIKITDTHTVNKILTHILMGKNLSRGLS